MREKRRECHYPLSVISSLENGFWLSFGATQTVPGDLDKGCRRSCRTRSCWYSGTNGNRKLAYRGGRSLDRIPGPGLDPDRVRGRAEAVGTGWNPLRTPPAPRPGDHHYASQIEDRPGGAGKGSRDRARQSARAYAAIRMHLPRTALDQWLRQAGIASGPVFCKVNFGENVQKGNTSRNGPPRRLRRTQFT